ncbi:ribonuclease P protein component [Williamsia sp. MIQD14]|uniref:ribonuclease P protein component n=1 Tax=Williamsia sp. MIQD14 TaxID=3425703 RepID=UPI003DA0D7BC
MLARHQRISQRSDFSRTLRHGVRVRRRDLMTYVLVSPDVWPDSRGVRVDVAEPAGPRVGLIVSKAVGNAVARHAVARRLRAASAEALQGVSTPSTVVIRALPTAADVSETVLAQQVSAAVDRSGLVRTPSATATGAAL